MTARPIVSVCEACRPVWYGQQWWFTDTAQAIRKLKDQNAAHRRRHGIEPLPYGRAAKFRDGRGIRPGDSIVVVGYPLRGFLASEANVTTGTVSALAGPDDDRRLFQITAPVQPGNSGGPVLDASGNVVGVVMAKLDAIRIARATGDIPQNINFAISAGIVRSFLDAQSVPYDTAPSTDELRPAELAVGAKAFTVVVECWK